MTSSPATAMQQDFHPRVASCRILFLPLQDIRKLQLETENRQRSRIYDHVSGGNGRVIERSAVDVNKRTKTIIKSAVTGFETSGTSQASARLIPYNACAVDISKHDHRRQTLRDGCSRARAFVSPDSRLGR